MSKKTASKKTSSKKVVIKTTKNDSSVIDYVNALEPRKVRDDAQQLLQLFADATGASAKMWGASIVGYGEYIYYRANGDQGLMMATGFSMRKSGPVLYIMPGYSEYQSLLDELGPHKLGKSCLYLKNLNGIDFTTIKKLIKLGVKDLEKNHEVSMF